MTEISRRSALTACALAVRAPAAAAAATADSRYLFDPSAYIARGTVFTRSVASMPVVRDSTTLAAAMASMPSKFAGAHGFSWLKTSLNSTAYNIPIYVVDSRSPGHPTRRFTVSRLECAGDPVVHHAAVPCPSHARPAEGGDKALAVYDIGQGILREYFHCTPIPGGWAASTAGWTRLGGPLTAARLATVDFPMRVTKGSSSVVKMHNPLSQVGFRELAAGVINHAVSFTFADAHPGSSWPAKQGDGRYPGVAPVQGQWFRLPPNLDLGALGLKPLTLMVARAVQRYGGYGADRNGWCHSVNLESPFSVPNATVASLLQPSLDNWRAGHDLGSCVNDFPWHLTQWAPLGWASTAQAPAAALPWRYTSSWTRTTSGSFRATGTRSVTAFDMRSDATAATGSRATITFTRPAFNETRARTYTVAPRVALPQAPVTVEVLRNGKVVSSCSSRSLRSLRFSTVAGRNTIAIRFTLSPPRSSQLNDIITLSAVTPV